MRKQPSLLLDKPVWSHFLQEAGGATLHYSSRCEKFARAWFLNNSQKNIKKSLAQEVRQKGNCLERRIIFYSSK